MAQAQAKLGDTVRTDYTGTLDDGAVFDSSAERGPLEFTIGNGQLIMGYEQAVIGMKVGDKKTVSIEAEQAYGAHFPEMVFEAPRSDFPPEIEPKLGDILEMHQQDGRVGLVRVIGAAEARVTLDANHPLAGKDLTFEITLVEIVEPGCEPAM